MNTPKSLSLVGELIIGEISGQSIRHHTKEKVLSQKAMSFQE